MSDQPHSAEALNEERDFYWNPDFLELMARRWRLDQVRLALDVGCGQGHWGRLLEPRLPKDAIMLGVDPESQWIERARKMAVERGLDHRLSYQLGSTDDLGVEPDRFDFITCQTVLIHLEDPAAGVRSMMAAARPGGLIAVAEPNNASWFLQFDSVSASESIDEILAVIRFYLTCERGATALGRGDSSFGNQVPGLFAEVGLVDIQAYVNDRPLLYLPPYDAPDQRLFRAGARDRFDRGLWIGDTRVDVRELFLAGGGDAGGFEAGWERVRRQEERRLDAMDAGTLHCVAGGGFFTVSGRKPG